MKRVGNWTVHLFLLCLVIIALLVSLLRLGMHNLHRYSDLVESALASELPGISFDGAYGDMNGMNPILTVDNAVFQLPPSEVEIKLEGVAIELSLWRSLLELSPVVRTVRGRIDGLQLRRHVSGNWLLNDYPLQFGGSGGGNLSFQRAILLLPEYVDLNFQNLEVVDEMQAQHHKIENVRAFLHEVDQTFEVELGISLPRSLGNGMLIKGRIGEANSLLHAQLSGLQISPLVDLVPFDRDWSGEGQLTGVTWLEFNGLQLTEVSGRVQLDDTTIAWQDRQPAELNYRGRFRVARDDTAWLVSNSVENLSLNEQILNTFDTELSLQPVNCQTQLSAWFDRMSLHNIVSLAPWLPDQQMAEQLTSANPEGLLQDAVVHLDTAQPGDLLLSSGVRSLSSLRVGEIPGVTNLSGNLLWHQGRTNLRLQGQDATIDFGDFFTEPMQLNDYQVSATIGFADQGLVISVPEIAVANQDAVAEGRVLVVVDDYRYPFLYVRGKVQEGRGNRVTPYLPARQIDAEIMQWLDQAILGGEIVSGDLLFHGRLNGVDKWAANQSGEMQIEGEFRKASMKFDPDWPAVEDASGQLTFHNMSVSAEVDNFVFVDRIKPESASFKIEDYKAAWVDLRIKSELPAEQSVATWLQIPLSEPQRDSFNRFTDYSGRIGANLAVRIPLASDLGDEQVDIDLELKDVAAKSDEFNVEVSRLRGALKIDQASIAADNITGRFFEDSVSMRLVPDSKAETTELIVNGQLSSANLVRMLPDEMRTRISGKSDWQLSLLFPTTSVGATSPELQIVAQSDLKGTAIDLPEPMAIKASDQHAFASRIQWFSRHMQYSVAIGDLAKLRGVMSRQVDEYQAQSMDIALGRGYRSGMQAGLRVYGQLPEFSTDQWLGILSAHSDENSDFLQLVDVNVTNADILGYQLNDVSFWLQRDGSQLNGNIEAPRVSGVFQLPPDDQPDAPIVVELDRLVLTDRDPLEDDTEVNPTDIPNLDFSARSLDFRGKQFDNVSVSVRRTGSGIKIERANAVQGKVKVSSAATWAYDPASELHSSLVSISAKGSRLGNTLETFGFGNVISGGKVEFNGDFRWAAPLTEFDLDSFSGAAELTIRDGVLNNVEPGAGGRLVGLFSISALPRRLSLDFKDMLVEGMEFEKISGTFRVSGENLVTKNTRLRGPTANIRISGTTGIKRRDYDQIMVVKPKLSASLPLIGTITAGSGIGWGLLLLHDLYKDAVNEAVEVTYEVKGSWDDPQITEKLPDPKENQTESTNGQDRR